MSGICQVRAVPASRMRRVVWREGDYEMELAYNEVVPPRDGERLGFEGLEGRWWVSPDGWRVLYGPG